MFLKQEPYLEIEQIKQAISFLFNSWQEYDKGDV